MEIERKYLISSVPFALSSYPCRKIEQGYLSTAPVVRIRRDNNDYILTYKSKGMMIREEYNLPLTKESYEHLKEKIDGRLITKKRYVIPLKDSLFIELDIFSGDLAPLMLAECTVMIGRRKGNVFAEPFGWSKVIGSLFISKL